MKILVDILDRAEFKQFSEECFSRYIDKIKGLEVEDTLHFPMSTIGKKIFYNSMFIALFPDDGTVDEKQEEIDKLLKWEDLLFGNYLAPIGALSSYVIWLKR